MVFRMEDDSVLVFGKKCRYIQNVSSSVVRVADQVIHRVMALPPGVKPSRILDLHSYSF